jgi:hypothetical protein
MAGLLSAAAPAGAREPDARGLIEEILTDPAADLTADVNTLLALGRARVEPILDRLSRASGSSTPRPVRTIRKSR